MAVVNLAFYGDSVTQGPGFSPFLSGGNGSYVEQVAEQLGLTPQLGPILSSGFRGLWNGQFAGFGPTTYGWNYTGTWTGVSQSAAYNRAPHAEAWEGANGSGSTTTYTLPPKPRTPAAGFAVYYIDSPTAGNWQFQVDGGTWTNMGEPILHDNKLKKVYFNLQVNSNVSFRQFDGSGAAGITLAGIEMYWADPRVNSGLIVHNIGRFGYWLRVSTQTAQNGSGADPFAWFDSCTIGTNAIGHTPFCTIFEFINDVPVIHNATTWGTDVSYAYNRVHPVTDVIWQSSWENAGTFSLQADYRAAAKASLVGQPGAQVVDFYDIFTARGWGNGLGTQAPAIVTAGFSTDTTHPTDTYGQSVVKETLYWKLRQSYPQRFSATQTGRFNIGTSRIASTDVLAGQLGITGTATDLVGITATLASLPAHGRTLTNAVGLTDSVGAHTARLRPIADAVGVSGTAAKTTADVRTFAEQVGVAGSAHVSASKRLLAETVGLSDTITAHVAFVGLLADTVGISGAPLTGTRHVFADVVGVADLQRVGIRRTCTDTVAITATAVKVLVLRPTFLNAVGIIEGNAKFGFFHDAVGTSSAVVATVVPVLHLSASFSETIGVTDTVQVTLVPVLHLSAVLHGTVGLTDTVVATFRLPAAPLVEPLVALLEPSLNSLTLMPAF